MTVYSRMSPRSEREKALLKYGERVERERIIKLLEEQFASSYWSDLSPEFLIALIKGEK